MDPPFNNRVYYSLEGDFDVNRTLNALNLVSDYIIKNTLHFPGKTAFVYNDQRISYRELNDRSELLAKYLLKLGVKKQDRIAYQFETQPEFFYLLIAASRIGAIIVGMGSKLTTPELEYIVKNSESDYLFFAGGDKPYTTRIKELLPHCPNIKHSVVAGCKTDALSSLTFADIFRERYQEFDQLLTERELQVNSDDGLLMLYTSGSTGQPKGAILSHRSIIHSCLVEADELRTTPDDVWLNNLPVNHVSGAIVQGMAPLLTSGTVVLLPSFSPSKTLELIENEKITIIGQVPTMYTLEFALPDYDKYDKSSIRCAHFGAAMAPITTIEKVINTMTANVRNCLGMTEASGVVAYTPEGASIDTLSKTVGKVIPEVEWKLVDKSRKTVKPGEIGEIAYRGSTIIKEYYKLTNTTRECIDEEGWFYSGDLFRQNENGSLVLMGRKKEMFITGGENVYSCEVERVINDYKDIETAAVIPVPDPVYGDVGYAYIVPKHGCIVDETELKRYLKNKLAKYKLPVKFIIRNELPLSPTGKVAKKILRQEIM